MGNMSERIYSRRKELNLTMEELAKIVGVDKSTINKWEKGVIENIRQPKIKALATALDCSPAWLIGVDDATENAYSIGKTSKDDRTSSYLAKIAGLTEADRELIFNLVDRLMIR